MKLKKTTRIGTLEAVLGKSKSSKEDFHLILGIKDQDFGCLPGRVFAFNFPLHLVEHLLGKKISYFLVDDGWVVLVGWNNQEQRAVKSVVQKLMNKGITRVRKYKVFDLNDLSEESLPYLITLKNKNWLEKLVIQ